MKIIQTCELVETWSKILYSTVQHYLYRSNVCTVQYIHIVQYSTITEVFIYLFPCISSFIYLHSSFLHVFTSSFLFFDIVYSIVIVTCVALLPYVSSIHLFFCSLISHSSSFTSCSQFSFFFPHSLFCLPSPRFLTFLHFPLPVCSSFTYLHSSHFISFSCPVSFFSPHSLPLLLLP